MDKYIGDEIMVVFSTEFGSDDPFLDALLTARDMIGYDPWAFEPHIGIASGPVIIGMVGTPLRYNCSVFGAPVAMAARCATESTANSVVFPAADWGDRSFEDQFLGPNDDPSRWELTPVRVVTAMKNLPDTGVRSVRRLTHWVPFGFTAEQHANAVVKAMLAKKKTQTP